MVEIINRDDIVGGVAGRRQGSPLGFVFHNDYGAMTPIQYADWLKRRKINGELGLGFAPYYISCHTILRVDNTNNKAWHTANPTGNAWYIGYEVTQSYYGVLTDEEFILNENMVLRQMAEDAHFYGKKPNRETVRLHKEFTDTSCPHRTSDIHGSSINAVKDYLIDKVKKYMALGKTVEEIIANENKVGAVVPVEKNDKINPFNVKETDMVALNQTRALYWSNGKPFSKNDFHKYWYIKSIENGVANIYSSRNETDGGWAVLHDLVPTNLDNPNNIVSVDQVKLNGRAKYWADKGSKAKQNFTKADREKVWAIKSIQMDSTANIYNVEDPTDGGWAVLHDLTYVK